MNPPTDPRLTLFLVHGRGVQPDAAELTASWARALAHGLARDREMDLGAVRIDMRYYADLTAPLDSNAAKFDPVLDRADRENAFTQLAALKAKSFRRSRYEDVPGQTPVKEFLADLGAPVGRLLGLARWRLAHIYPELTAYWQDAELAAAIRSRIVPALGESLRRGDHIMVLSHGIGSVFCYDAFWEASQQVSSASQRVHSWVTLGSPLSDDDVRHRLGGQPAGFPNLLLNWYNVAAEDDPICHDETVADDFKAMLRERHLSRIEDYHIYNLTERYGASDPHDVLGYLIHPRMARLLGDWITAFSGTSAPAPGASDRQ
ncbi:MAG: hypothetical protein AB7I04_17780 [Pseudomonadales bacterium]